MVTLLRNHPFEPAVPVIVKLTVGVAAAVGATISAARKAMTSRFTSQAPCARR